MGSDGREQAYKYLVEVADRKGYVLFDDIMSCADKWSLPIQDVDWLSNIIATRGILIYDSVPATSRADAEEDIDDYAQCDYDAVFDRVIEIDPLLETFITEIRSIKPPQMHEIDQLKYQVKERNLYARQRMIEMHLRFAVRIALQRVEQYGCEMADTLQDACLGLIYGVDRYDPDSSGPFGSYVSLWILQNISRNQPTQRPLVYYPVHKKEQYFNLYPALKVHGYLDGEEIASPEDAIKFIQEELECDKKQAKDVLNECTPLDSLEEIREMLLRNIEKHDDNAFQDDFIKRLVRTFISDSSVEKNIIEESCRRQIKETLGTLRDREQKVIRLRYGLDDGRERTLEEVGREFNITRERVRQIESKALRKLRHLSRSRKLRDYLD